VPLPQPVLDEPGHLWLTHHNRRALFPNHFHDAPLNNRALLLGHASIPKARLPLIVMPAQNLPRVKARVSIHVVIRPAA